MPTFQENIKTIETAIYGKEMRPAIKEALEQTKIDIDNMITQVNDLNKRVDEALKEPGSPDDPDQPDQPTVHTGSYVIGDATICADRVFTETAVASDADKF